MAVYKTWNLLTLDNKPYTVGITDQGQTFIAFGSIVAGVDPAALGAALAQVDDALAELHALKCSATLAAGSLSCDWQPNHTQQFQHDPRGFFWREQEVT